MIFAICSLLPGYAKFVFADFLSFRGYIMRKIVLPEFQDYMRAKNLVNEKYIRFYAHWANKFLSFSKSNGNLSYVYRFRSF